MCMPHKYALNRDHSCWSLPFPISARWLTEQHNDQWVSMKIWPVPAFTQRTWWTAHYCMANMVMSSTLLHSSHDTDHHTSCPKAFMLQIIKLNVADHYHTSRCWSLPHFTWFWTSQYFTWCWTSHFMSQGIHGDDASHIPLNIWVWQPQQNAICNNKLISIRLGTNVEVQYWDCLHDKMTISPKMNTDHVLPSKVCIRWS